MNGINSSQLNIDEIKSKLNLDGSLSKFDIIQVFKLSELKEKQWDYYNLDTDYELQKMEEGFWLINDTDDDVPTNTRYFTFQDGDSRDIGFKFDSVLEVGQTYLCKISKKFSSTIDGVSDGVIHVYGFQENAPYSLIESYVDKDIDNVITSLKSNSFIPNENSTYNLGSSEKIWKNVYSNHLYTTSVDSGTVLPLNSNNFNLGSSSKLWKNIYVNNINKGAKLTESIDNNSNGLVIVNKSYIDNNFLRINNDDVSSIESVEIDSCEITNVHSENPQIVLKSSTLSGIKKGGFYKINCPSDMLNIIMNDNNYGIGASDYDISLLNYGNVIYSDIQPSSLSDSFFKELSNLVIYINENSRPTIYNDDKKISSGIIPSVNCTFSLGSSEDSWKEIYTKKLIGATLEDCVITSINKGAKLTSSIDKNSDDLAIANKSYVDDNFLKIGHNSISYPIYDINTYEIKDNSSGENNKDIVLGINDDNTEDFYNSSALFFRINISNFLIDIIINKIKSYDDNKLFNISFFNQKVELAKRVLGTNIKLGIITHYTKVEIINILNLLNDNEVVLYKSDMNNSSVYIVEKNNILYKDIIPNINNLLSLGSPNMVWDKLYVNTIKSNDIMPSKNKTSLLGTSAYRWKSVYTYELIGATLKNCTITSIDKNSDDLAIVNKSYVDDKLNIVNILKNGNNDYYELQIKCIKDSTQQRYYFKTELPSKNIGTIFYLAGDVAYDLSKDTDVYTNSDFTTVVGRFEYIGIKSSGNYLCVISDKDSNGVLTFRVISNLNSI